MSAALRWFRECFYSPYMNVGPIVVLLAVHLKNNQQVHFTAANAAQRAESLPATTLTVFFATYDPFARTMLYL